jgi:hypothetical protein
MDAATNASPGWAEERFLASTRTAPASVVIAGIDRSPIVQAALADPALAETTVVHFVPHATLPNESVIWRCETANGEPLNRAGVLRRYWHRAPFSLTVRLVRHETGTAEILDEGTIGTRGPWDAFRAAVDRLAMRFVRDVALGRSRGPALAEPSVPGRSRPGLGGGGWLGYQAARWHERFFTEWWSIGDAAVSHAAIVAGAGLGPLRWHHVAAGDRYLADPFPWPGRDLILAEEMPVRDGVGRIVAVPKDSGASTAPVVVLEDGAHHSYPCTYTEGGVVYCVPEATDRGCTRICRLDDDGTLHTIATPAPDLRLADSTLFHYNNCYWIACTDLDIGVHDNLCLLHAPSLTGPWKPHALWPVKVDIRSARPAGSVFVHAGCLYRPAQDCAATYGAGVAVNEIRVLSETAFAESVVTVLRPDATGPFPHGLHTLTHDGERFWIDGKRFVFDPGLVGRKAINKIAQLVSRTKAE